VARRRIEGQNKKNPVQRGTIDGQVLMGRLAKRNAQSATNERSAGGVGR